METYHPFTFTDIVCKQVAKKYFEGIGIPPELKEKYLPERQKLNWESETGETFEGLRDEEMWLDIDCFAVPHLFLEDDFLKSLGLPKRTDFLKKLGLPKKQPKNYDKCIYWSGHFTACQLNVLTTFVPGGFDLLIKVIFSTRNYCKEIEYMKINSCCFVDNIIPDEWLEGMSELAWETETNNILDQKCQM